MDFGLIREGLVSNKYPSHEAFAADIRLVNVNTWARGAGFSEFE